MIEKKNYPSFKEHNPYTEIKASLVIFQTIQNHYSNKVYTTHFT